MLGIVAHGEDAAMNIGIESLDAPLTYVTGMPAACNAFIVPPVLTISTPAA